MLRIVQWGALAVAVLALGACGTRLQDAQMVSPGGSAFDQALYKYYTQRSGEEYAEGDYINSDYFADKAIAAAGGESVGPDEVSSRDIPSDKVNILDSARARLLAALDGGGREAAADAAGLAQMKFDCWLEEQEENIQPDDIEACKAAFFAALREVEAALVVPEPEPEPEPAPAPAPLPEEEEFIIYFDFDRSNIRADQEAAMWSASRAALTSGERTISVFCHTDTAGQLDYNQALSVRRCNSVIGQLIDGGVNPGRIYSLPVGESQPLVDTGDGVAEQGNRAAVLTIEVE